MADVSPIERPSRDSAGDDRGQLFLIGALALAVTFVVLALVMNGVIYTENVSARDLGTSTTPAIEYENEARNVAGRLLADERGSGYDEMRGNVTGGLGNWSDTTQPFGSAEGRLAGVEEPSASNGTALEQANGSRELTAADGGSSWELADDVRTRDAWINATPTVAEGDVDGTDFGNLTNDTGPVHLNVSNGSTTQTVFLYENGSTTCVAVFEDGTYLSEGCVPDDDARLRLDLVSGTYADAAGGGESELAELRVLERAGGDHDLEFGNGDAANGTYRFVVDAEVGSTNVHDSRFNTTGPDADSPRAVKVPYDADFRIRYRTTNVRYEAAVHVAPGEPDYE